MSGRPNCYFIIYIAPLHKNYSEALPTPVRLKRTVFKREKNERDKVQGKRRSSSGRPFQVEGSTTGKGLDVSYYCLYLFFRNVSITIGGLIKLKNCGFVLGVQ